MNDVIVHVACQQWNNISHTKYINICIDYRLQSTDYRDTRSVFCIIYYSVSLSMFLFFTL